MALVIRNILATAATAGYGSAVDSLPCTSIATCLGKGISSLSAQGFEGAAAAVEIYKVNRLTEVANKLIDSPITLFVMGVFVVLSILAWTGQGNVVVDWTKAAGVLVMKICKFALLIVVAMSIWLVVAVLVAQSLDEDGKRTLTIAMQERRMLEERLRG